MKLIHSADGRHQLRQVRACCEIQSQPSKILLSPVPASTYRQFPNTPRSGFSHPPDKLESEFGNRLSEPSHRVARELHGNPGGRYLDSAWPLSLQWWRVERAANTSLGAPSFVFGAPGKEKRKNEPISYHRNTHRRSRRQASCVQPRGNFAPELCWQLREAGRHSIRYPRRR